MRTFERILKDEGIMNEDDVLNLDYERCAEIYAAERKASEELVRNIKEQVSSGKISINAARLALGYCKIPS